MTSQNGKSCKLKSECRVGGRTPGPCSEHSKGWCFRAKSIDAADNYTQLAVCVKPQNIPGIATSIKMATDSPLHECAALCDADDRCTTFRLQDGNLCNLKSKCAVGESVGICPSKKKCYRKKLVFSSKPVKPKPNLVFFFTDDQGYANVGFRNDAVVTPHMDAVSHEGVILDRHYTHSWCSPTRASFLSGRNPMRIDHNWPHPEIEFLPRILERAGYNTAQVGKWHVGKCSDDTSPHAKGFLTSFGSLDLSPIFWMDEFSGKGSKEKYVGENGEELLKEAKCHVQGDCDSVVDLFQYPPDQVTNLSITKPYNTFLYSDYIHNLVYNHTITDPIFLYINPTQPHTPLGVTHAYKQPYLDRGHTEEFAVFNGMISAVDDMLGSVVADFKDRGMWDNTLFVYTSDNGGLTCKSTVVPGHATNYPLRGSRRRRFSREEFGRLRS
jgi:hypothetical protein